MSRQERSLSRDRVDVAVVGGGLAGLAAGALLARAGLDWREKLEVGKLLAGLRGVDPAAHSGVAVGDWIDRRLDSPPSRQLLRALVRLTTYCLDDDLDAGAAVAMLQKGAEGALYLDGGWQTLVDGLRHAARENGARLRTSCRIEEVRLSDARAHPGWRERVEARRFLPGAVVSHDVPTVESGGPEGRYGPDVHEADPLFVAGDWVGPDGMLSDAAAASARAAARRIVARDRA